MINEYQSERLPVERPISAVRFVWLKVLPVAVVTLWAFLLLGSFA